MDREYLEREIQRLNAERSRVLFDLYNALDLVKDARRQVAFIDGGIAFAQRQLISEEPK